MEDTFDFIIVGAGASGCVVASRLANSPGRPSVLLLEAGGSNQSAADLSGTERFNLAFSPGSPYNWSYQTSPQHQLAGQKIDYSRGKGLGGSTAINFCGWTVGARDDFDEYAALVGDDRFGWENVKKCLQRIERVHLAIPDERLRKYVNAKAEADHGLSGSIDLTYGDAWMANVGDIFVAAAQAGLPLNEDVNSGDPIGMGMGTVSITPDGRRLTAADAYLQPIPTNLTILEDAMVSRVTFENKRASGVETLSGKTYRAKCEIILSGGAINTPQLLLLSGVGPAEELSRHEIEQVQELPMVGQNLQDHCFSAMGIVLDRKADKDVVSQSPSPMGWFKLADIADTQECIGLPEHIRLHRSRVTVPDFEIATHTPPSFVGHVTDPDTEFLGAICLLMNPQSKGSVRLHSNDPSAAPLIDPNFLSHAFDRRFLIEGMKVTKRLLTAPLYAEKTLKTYIPVDDSDEAIWEHIRTNTASSWHMSSTAKMGRSAEDACVDSRFRVFGLNALRVVDMSVAPFVPSCHTQSTAYIFGELASEILLQDYGFGGATKAKL